jgi:acetyl-CoA carboxylase biotin carboxyl carrier protein
MDIEHIKSLVELMVENDLSKIELQEGETHILLRRGQPPVVSHLSATAGPPAATPTTANPTGAPAVPTEAPPSEPAHLLIRSPMVGTFYAASDPESPAFVKVGDTVEPDTVVCLVEAMKVFNEINAEVSGRVTKVLVSNAEAVEYDQPLFAVEPV